MNEWCDVLAASFDISTNGASLTVEKCIFFQFLITFIT